MQAFVFDRYKSKSAVRLGEMPEPEVRDDDVLVQVHAASLNQLDSKIRDGEFKLIVSYRLPLILGNDVAGVVVCVGSNVRRFKPGDEVYARPHQDRIGTFAEFIAMNEADVALKPKNLTMEEAASIPLVGLTAWQALIERAHLKKGQKVLIHAGSGGVGTFAIQLAKHVGATVATTRLKPGGQVISISGPPDAAFARSQGASWVLRMIMGLLSYRIRAKAKRRGINYSFLLMRANGGQLTELTSLIDKGIIRPVVDRVFPFASTKDA